jgi:hypothetical protein
MKHALTLDGSQLMKWLNLLYDAIASSLSGTGASQPPDSSYARDGRALADQIDALILWHTLAAAGTGFVSGLGGLITMPITIPTDVAATLVIQLRLAIAIAARCGYNPHDERVRAFCLVCLCGNAASDALRGVGIKVGTSFAKQGVGKVSGKVLAEINAAVGFRLMTKFGQTGIINLGKGVPLVGGAIGAAFDGTTTGIVGQAAKRTFFEYDVLCEAAN